MSEQSFILSYILSEMEKRIMDLDWYDLKVSLNDNAAKDDSVCVAVKIYDVNARIYQNINDKVRVGQQLVPRPLPVESFVVIFVSSKNMSNQLKAVGVILQAFRDNRKIDVGEYSWLNNKNSPLTIDSFESHDLDMKMRLQEIWGQPHSLPLFFNVSCAIDSKKAEGFVEVKERIVQMEKIDV